jgi:hypothetical protein
MVTRRVPSPRNNAVTRGNKTPPPVPRPRPGADACVGGVGIVLAPPPTPPEKSTIFRIVAREPIPNRDSHFPLCKQRAL